MGNEFWRTGNTSANRQQLSLREPKDLFGLQWLRTSVAELRSAPTQSVVVPYAGHFPWIERTSLVLKTVRLFTR